MWQVISCHRLFAGCCSFAYDTLEKETGFYDLLVQHNLSHNCYFNTRQSGALDNIQWSSHIVPRMAYINNSDLP